MGVIDQNLLCYLLLEIGLTHYKVKEGKSSAELDYIDVCSYALTETRDIKRERAVGLWLNTSS
jgi:hypothetical protein